MASQSLSPKFAAVESDPVAVAQLLGGRRGFGGGVPDDPFALHDRLARGLPARALAHFARRFPLLARDPAFARVLGSAAASHESLRSARSGRLSSQESGQLWRLADLFTKAAPLFGGLAAAERWLLCPALGLGRRRPLDLLETPAGQQLVAEHLIQLEYGVYV